MGFWDFLDSGSSSAEKGYRRGIERATQTAAGGYDKAIEGMQTSYSSYDPEVASGNEALQEYSNLVFGRTDISDDPYYKLSERLGKQSMVASGTGGETASAALSAQLLPQYTSYRYGQLAPLMELGYGAKGQQTGIQQGIGGLEIGKAGTLASGMMLEEQSKYRQRGGGQPTLGNFLAESASQGIGMAMNAMTGGMSGAAGGTPSLSSILSSGGNYEQATYA